MSNDPATSPSAASGGGTDDDLDETTVPAGPPWSVDVLADLHAGRYRAEIAGPLRRRIADDPWASSVLTALDATVDELSLLPDPRMPERLALRLDAAIAAEYRATTAAPAPAAGAASATESAAAQDRGVPQPRRPENQSLSVSQTRQQVGGGQAAPPRRTPPFAGPPAVQHPEPGPRPQPPVPPVFRAGPPPGVQPGRPAAPEPSSAPSSMAPSSATGAAPPDRTAAEPPTSFAASTVATVHSLHAARTKRRRWVGGLVAAAAVIGIGTATVASLHHSADTGGLAVASATSSSAPGGAAPAAPAPGGGSGAGDTNALQLDPGRFGDALKQIEGKRPVGSLQDAATYSRCLAANAIDPSAVQGVRSATFDGKPAAAIAVVVDAGHSKVVVVGPACGINGAADQLAAQLVAR